MPPAKRSAEPAQKHEHQRSGFQRLGEMELLAVLILEHEVRCWLPNRGSTTVNRHGHTIAHRLPEHRTVDSQRAPPIADSGERDVSSTRSARIIMGSWCQRHPMSTRASSTRRRRRILPLASASTPTRLVPAGIPGSTRGCRSPPVTACSRSARAPEPCGVIRQADRLQLS